MIHFKHLHFVLFQSPFLLSVCALGQQPIDLGVIERSPPIEQKLKDQLFSLMNSAAENSSGVDFVLSHLPDQLAFATVVLNSESVQGTTRGCPRFLVGDTYKTEQKRIYSSSILGEYVRRAFETHIVPTTRIVLK